MIVKYPTMSIENPSQSQPSIMVPEKHRSKPDKKQKSSHGEKKRKREHGEEVPKLKSKKHKSDKAVSQSSAVELASIVSPFHVQTSSLYLPLAPISQNHPIEGMCAEHLSPLILRYYPPFSGVVLSYSDPRLSEKPFGNDGNEVLLHNIDEYAVSWSWVTAEFLLFKPENGEWLEGYINFQTDGSLGLVCWNLFNANIERKRLPTEWKWMDVGELENEGSEEAGRAYAEEGAGYYVDGEGKKVEGMVKFRVKDIESSHDRERGFLSINGTMLSKDAEAELVEIEKSSVNDAAGRRLRGARALGATNLGIVVESDVMDADASGKKPWKKF